MDYNCLRTLKRYLRDNHKGSNYIIYFSIVYDTNTIDYTEVIESGYITPKGYLIKEK